jgi:hypothetical protein
MEAGLKSQAEELAKAFSNKEIPASKSGSEEMVYEEKLRSKKADVKIKELKVRPLDKEPKPSDDELKPP